MRIKNLLFSLFSALLISVAISGCHSSAEPRNSNTTFIQDAMRPLIESGECPGAISILYNNGWQEVACMGFADVERQIPMSLDRMFMQCSQTKGFCGVTIAILIEEGKISLDDPVSKYLPEFKDLKVVVKDADGKVTGTRPAQNELTIRMVMNHTGGFGFEIPTKRRQGWPALSLRDTAREAAANPLLFEPGTSMTYSNTGIDIGAAIVEVVTGKSWDVFLKERVLDPLGMTDTTFNPTDEQLSRSILMYNFAAGQKAQFREFHPSMPLPHNGPGIHPSAGAGLWTTASDQLKFYKMLMNLGVGDNGVRILQEETVRNYLATSTRPEGLGYYSMGLSVMPNNGFFGHGGAWGTNCVVNPDKKQLNLWVVQLIGDLRPISAVRYPAAEAFFAIDLDSSEIDAYSSRME